MKLWIIHTPSGKWKPRTRQAALQLIKSLMSGRKPEALTQIFIEGKQYPNADYQRARLMGGILWPRKQKRST